MERILETTTFAFPTEIRFGLGVRRELPQALAAAGSTRPLVVTDRGVAKLSMFAELFETLERQANLEPALFSELGGNPHERDVEAGLEAFLAHDADAVVCVGGGAPTDVGKAVALVAANPGSILEYAEDAPKPRTPERTPVWIAALPTTAGTGSEVGRSAVISENETHRKRVVFVPSMLPRLVLADPEWLIELPPGLSAATGMDALSHLFEAFLATGLHPMCDGIALEGLRLVHAHLLASVEDGTRIEARAGMLMASIMGAVAFQKGLGVTHACAHALGAVLDVHHGLANGVMLPYAARFNLETARARLSRIAHTLGLGERPEDTIAWLERLRTDVGLPERLGALGVQPDMLGKLATLAEQDGCLLTNPRPADRETLEALFAEAL